MSKTIRIFLTIIIVVIVGLIYFGLSQDDNAPVNEGPIEIGFIAPITGPFADWGRTIHEGFQLALEDTKHEFTVIYQDSQCDPTETVNIGKKFLDINNIKLIIGPGCITGLKALAPLAEASNALLFSTGLLDDEVFETHQNIINLASQISTEGRYLAKYLSEQDVKKIAIIHGTNAFGQEYGKRLPVFLKKYDMEITSIHPSSLDETDFKTIILKIMNDSPDVIYIHQGEKQIGIFAKQIRQLGYDTQIYSYYAIEGESVVNAGGVALENIIYTYPYNSKEDSIEKEEFETRYAEKFGEDKIPSATSFFVYDGMMLLDEALDSCQSKDSECIADYFKNYGYYNGVSGDLTFEKDGSIIRPFGIKKIENGEFVWLLKEIEL